MLCDLWTILDSAYYSSGSSDFVEIISTNQPLKEFSIHRRRQCFSVTITNDDMTEENETFIVILEKPSKKSFPQVQIHPGVVKITISDDDQCKCTLCDLWLDDTLIMFCVFFPHIALPNCNSSFSHCDSTCTYVERRTRSASETEGETQQVC